MNPYDCVELPESILSIEDFNCLLGQLENTKKFDDLNFAGGRHVIVKSGGSVFRIKGRTIKPREVDFLAGLIGKGANVSSDVRGGRQLDPSYQFTHDERLIYRYRVNISAMREGGQQQIKVAMRAIRAEIPSLEYVRISEKDFSSMAYGPGLVIVSGETGSGKTTTIAGVIGEIIRRSGSGKGGVICAYEQPCEFMYGDLVKDVLATTGQCNVEVYQHEIGTDLKSFGEGVRNALRSNPDIIILGEAREFETISAALTFALSGHLVFITTHAKGAIATLTRLVSEFPESRQSAAFLSFLSCTKLIMSQELVLSKNGDRVPVREQLKIDERMQGEFSLCHSYEQANQKLSTLFSEKGQRFEDSAKALHDSDEISDAVFNFYRER